MSLAEALENAAQALPERADAIRPANGDPWRLLESLDASGAEQVLRWLLVNETDAGAELALGWAEAPEGVSILQTLDGSALPKAGRKALGRARHRLRSQGVAVATPPPEPTVAKLPAIDEDLSAAFVTPIDPVGARVAYLVVPNPAGGARLFEMVLDETRGIVDCHVYETGRKNVRRFAREVAKRDRFPALPVSPDALRALVARVASRQPTERPPPRPFRDWRKELAGAPPGTKTPGEETREALGSEAASDRVASAVELVKENRVGPWPPPVPMLREAAETLKQVSEGKIVLTGSARREKFESSFRGIIDRVFDEPFRVLTAERFEEAAHVFHAGGDEDEARACLAAADLFRENEPDANPVARAMLEIVLAPALKELGEEEEDSVLVKP